MEISSINPPQSMSSFWGLLCEQALRTRRQIAGARLQALVQCAKLSYRDLGFSHVGLSARALGFGVLGSPMQTRQLSSHLAVQGVGFWTFRLNIPCLCPVRTQGFHRSHSR